MLVVGQNLPRSWADTEQHVQEWNQWVQVKCTVSGAPQFHPVATPDGSVREPIMERKQAKLEVGVRDDEGVLGYVDVSYTNACTFDEAATGHAVRTAGKAADEREEHKRKRELHVLERCPHAELTPLVVEARGRLGAEVCSFGRAAPLHCVGSRYAGYLHPMPAILNPCTS